MLASSGGGRGDKVISDEGIAGGVDYGVTRYWLDRRRLHLN